METITFRERLRKARTEKGIKQKELAKILGCVPQTISMYERTEDGRLPSLDVAAQLAKTLGVSLDWLAGVSENEEGGDSRSFVETIEHLSEISEFECSEGKFLGRKVAKVTFFGDAEVNFLLNRGTMLSLLNRGAINAQIYNSWLEGIKNAAPSATNTGNGKSMEKTKSD